MLNARQWIMVTGAAAVAGVALAQQVPGAMDLMTSTIIPASNVVFAVGKKAPATNAEWDAVQKSAANLIDAARRLESIAPADNSAAWQRFAKEMAGAARKSGDAAKARDVDAVLDAGDALYESCADCHRIFLKK